jgi:ABC-2 type transport system permease protein
MTVAIMQLTARALLGRRRVIFLALLALATVVIGAAYRAFADHQETVPPDFAVGLVEVFVLSAVLPLAALVLGTSALGGEIEDGTIIYLLAKPVARWRIYTAKLVVSTLATIAVVVPLTAAAMLITMAGDEFQLTLAFTIALAIGAAVYCALFVSLSIFTSRALIAGMVYVFVWEATITNLLTGTRVLAVRHYVLGIAGEISSVPEPILDPHLSGTTAIIAAVIVTTGAVAAGIRWLQNFEIGERL